MSTLFITILSFIGLSISYIVGRLVTAPWRTTKLPPYVSFKYTNLGGMRKQVDLLYRGKIVHTAVLYYDLGDPVKNMKRAQKTLLRRFQATSMCQIFLSKD